jgi:hypothetical protein
MQAVTPGRCNKVTIPVFKKLPRRSQAGGLLGTVSTHNLSGAIVREQNATTGHAGAVCFIRIVVEVTKANACITTPNLVQLAEVDLSEHGVTASSVSILTPEGTLAGLVAACSIAFASARAQRIPWDVASFKSVLSGNASAVTADFIRTCAEKRGPSMLEAVLVYQMIKGI